MTGYIARLRKRPVSLWLVTQQRLGQEGARKISCTSFNASTVWSRLRGLLAPTFVGLVVVFLGLLWVAAGEADAEGLTGNPDDGTAQPPGQTIENDGDGTLPAPASEPAPTIVSQQTSENDPRSAPHPRTDPATEPNPDTSTQPSPDTTTEPSPDTTTEPSPDTTTEPSPDTTTEPSPEPSPDTTTEPSPDTTTEPSPDTTTEPSQARKDGPEVVLAQVEPLAGLAAADATGPTHELSPQLAANFAAGLASEEATDPAVESATAGQIGLVDDLITPYLKRIADAAGELLQMVRWLLGGDAEVPTPVKDIHIPPSAPGIPPPASPIPIGSSPFGGGSVSNGLTSFGGVSGSSVEKYGAWSTLPTPLLQGSELFWPSDALLGPNSIQQSPIERPG
jgi:hypothetical protein